MMMMTIDASLFVDSDIMLWWVRQSVFRTVIQASLSYDDDDAGDYDDDDV